MVVAAQEDDLRTCVIRHPVIGAFTVPNTPFSPVAAIVTPAQIVMAIIVNAIVKRLLVRCIR